MLPYKKPIKCFTYVLNHERMTSHVVRILLVLESKRIDNPDNRSEGLNTILHTSKYCGINLELNHYIKTDGFQV